MGVRGEWSTARFIMGVALAAGVAACASAGSASSRPVQPELAVADFQARTALDSLGASEMLATRKKGPHVSVHARSSGLVSDRKDLTFRVDQDAYVAVFQVGNDGHLEAIFPSDPTQSSLVQGDVSYEMRSVFSGFDLPAYTYAGNTYAEQHAWIEGTGYVFAIASDRPLDLVKLDDEDLWDTYRLASRPEKLNRTWLPYDMAHMIVQPGAKWDVSVERFFSDLPYTTYAAYRATGCPGYGIGWAAYPIASYGFSNGFCDSGYGFASFGLIGYPYFGYGGFYNGGVIGVPVGRQPGSVTPGSRVASGMPRPLDQSKKIQEAIRRRVRESASGSPANGAAATADAFEAGARSARLRDMLRRAEVDRTEVLRGEMARTSPRWQAADDGRPATVRPWAMPTRAEAARRAGSGASGEYSPRSESRPRSESSGETRSQPRSEPRTQTRSEPRSSTPAAGAAPSSQPRAESARAAARRP